ncbi:hypothetical protein DVJ83_08290 [Deinococcus wulumuqiensis]|uniref:Uncharacterized protein n=1 Tax=Deinococcus wulumuqiensis TaxID=980427 RepID=A0A345IHI8_9DEIO|nr:hypothetical protein DVJ83_08290 [Deinococcus wulumuqiensis]
MADRSGLEQFSELRDARNGTPPHSILRPAQCFALAPLAKKTLRLFVKCSMPNLSGETVRLPRRNLRPGRFPPSCLSAWRPLSR